MKRGTTHEKTTALNSSSLERQFLKWPSEPHLIVGYPGETEAMFQELKRLGRRNAF